MDDPQLAARNLKDAAERAGARFHWGKRVTGMSYNSSRTAVTGVVLDDGTCVEAPLVLNASGPHSSILHKIAFSGADIQDDSLVSSRPMRVEVAVLPAPEGLNPSLDSSLPWVADNDLGVYYRPQFPGQILIGGSEPECDPKHFLNQPDEMDESLSEEWTNLVYRAAMRFPSLPIPNSARGLAALYDVSDDWLPIYDRSALGGWYSVNGTSGNQFKNAPVVGSIIREIVEATERGDNHDAEPVQLRLERTGQVLNLGTFSRLRKSSDTSGTVMG